QARVEELQAVQVQAGVEVERVVEVLVVGGIGRRPVGEIDVRVDLRLLRLDDRRRGEDGRELVELEARGDELHLAPPLARGRPAAAAASGLRARSFSKMEETLSSPFSPRTTLRRGFSTRTLVSATRPRRSGSTRKPTRRCGTESGEGAPAPSTRRS